MSENKAMVELREAVRVVRDEKGIKVISCDSLIAYLDDVIKSPSDDLTHFEKEKHSAEWQNWVEQNKAFESRKLEMVRAILAAGQNTLRNCFLMNSGATVALLAFLGKLSETETHQIPVFASSLRFFVLGTFLVGLAYGGTYLTLNFQSLDRKWSQYLGVGLNASVILLVLASYGVFLWGAWVAYQGFLNFR